MQRDTSTSIDHDGSDVLSLDQIEQRFAGRWVFIADPQFDEHGRLLRGRVVFDAVSRDEAYGFDEDRRHQGAAVLYVGAWPKDVDFQL